MRPVAAIAVLAVWLAGCDSTEDAAPPLPAPARISEAGVSEHLEALQHIADQNDGNRAAGTPGYDESADYVAARLRAAGWHVERQSFAFPYFEERSASVTAGSVLRPDRDFRVVTYSGSGRATAPLADAGRACSGPELEGVRAAVAIARPGGCLFRAKARAARRAGARALLLVDPARGAQASSATLLSPGAKIPVAVVSRKRARRMRFGERVTVEVRATSERRTTTNVVAETRNGDGDRVVMAGGHLDSVAAGPGINDNGSGVAALLAIAETVGRSPPGARLRLGFWSAEELALLGSRAYVEGLARGERRRVGAYLNLDMVGSPNGGAAVYSSSQSHAPARRTAARIERILSDRMGVRREAKAIAGASDHVPFAEAGIPVGGVFTGASERGPGGRLRDPCYHLACDTAANVDARLLARVARAVRRALLVLGRQAK